MFMRLRNYTIYLFPDGREEQVEGTALALDDTVCANCAAPTIMQRGYVYNGDYDSGGYYYTCSCGMKAYEVRDIPRK